LNNTPKNDENNGFLGGSIWYRTGSVVSFLQFMLDDVDLANVTEPSSFGAAGSIALIDILGPGAFRIGGSAVGSRSYNTHQPEGQYIYLLRGLATQFNDYVSAFVSLDMFLDNSIRGLTLTPRLDVLWQGELDIRTQPFPESDMAGTILTGVTQRTLRAALQIRYEPSGFFYIAADAGYNRTENADHISGKSESRLVAIVQAVFRLRLDAAYDLGL